MEVYYHYTTPQSGLSIINSRVIKKSTKKAKRRDDARYGEGVYLTKMSPSANLYKIAFNNYDGMSQDAIRRIIDSGEHCMEMPANWPESYNKLFINKKLILC